MKKFLLLSFFVGSIHIANHPLSIKDYTLNPQWSFESKKEINNLKAKLNEFNLLYEKRPIKENDGGMRFVAMFWVWYTVQNLQPNLIIESGIWRGQSTWLLEQAAPQAKIISLDPNLNNRIYISPHVTYSTQDFSKLNFGDISSLTTCCFFDDHINAFDRVIQASQKGFTHLIFDDNYPFGTGGHLTLQHCLKNGKFKTIESLISSYQMFPQLFGQMVKLEGKDFNMKTFNFNEKNSRWNMYERDAAHYRFTTYIELSKSI